jgi:hypothetical protein
VPLLLERVVALGVERACPERPHVSGEGSKRSISLINIIILAFLISFYSLAAQKTSIHEKSYWPFGHFNDGFGIRVPRMGAGFQP